MLERIVSALLPAFRTMKHNHRFVIVTFAFQGRGAGNKASTVESGY